MDGLDLPGWALPAGALAIVALLGSSKSGRTAVTNLFDRTFDFAKAAAFMAAVPVQIKPWVPQILSSARRYNVDPWALAAIMYNESRGGTARGYTPLGAGGSGDFIPRKPGNLYYKHADPSTGLPNDNTPGGKALGWGRGLMQVDYGVHNEWFTSGANWRDAQTNIDKGASLLRWNLDFFARAPGASIPVEAWRLNTGMPQYGILPWKTKYPRSTPWPTSVPDVRPLSGQRLYEAAIAAYNVSFKGVQQALGLGLPAEAGTAHQTYVSSFMNLVAGWRANFK